MRLTAIRLLCLFVFADAAGTVEDDAIVIDSGDFFFKFLHLQCMPIIFRKASFSNSTRQVGTYLD